MINGIHHVGLTFANAKMAARFYAAAASLETLAAPTLALPLDETAIEINGASLLRGPNAYVRLLEPKHAFTARNDRRPVAEEGIVHLCMQSPSIEDLYAKFKHAGATFHAPPVDLGTGFLYSYARDIENNVVELEGVSPVWEDTTPWIAHVSFSSANIDRLTDFYATVFGRKSIKSPHFGPHARMDLVSGMCNTQFRAAWIPAGNMQVEIIQYFEPPTLALNQTRAMGDIGYSYVCIEVSDLPAAIIRLQSGGAMQSSALAQMSAKNRYFCSDPDGNIILLLCLNEAERGFSISSLSDSQITARMAAKRELLLKQQKTA